MPKYYCDYCDIYLTHDSPSVRKSHNDGWKHKAAVKAYYSQFEQDETQEIINARIRAYEQKLAFGNMPPPPFGYPPMNMPPMMPPFGGPPPFGRPPFYPPPGPGPVPGNLVPPPR
eukprot:TRINITY_DN8779_c0_g1_i1.p1 TRINITY_DN8779_c0_g1~~TRINITY_DN8779_c0_g1_i1.p1  ORF type:complete len:115 (-),score=26.87 TRINITY_DN8779_c0_g1_i1:65-409(-)